MLKTSDLALPPDGAPARAGGVQMHLPFLPLLARGLNRQTPSPCFRRAFPKHSLEGDKRAERGQSWDVSPFLFGKGLWQGLHLIHPPTYPHPPVPGD